MAKQLFKFRQVPTGWTLCYLNDCPAKGTCQRYIAGTYAPKSLTFTSCVTPQALPANGPCRHYVEAVPISVAYGFNGCFRRVRRDHYNDMRYELINYFRNETAFYRYQRGNRPLMPEQQQWMRDLFRRYGYADELTFERTDEVYVFPYATP